jgi:hypothetical protein
MEITANTYSRGGGNTKRSQKKEGEKIIPNLIPKMIQYPA